MSGKGSVLSYQRSLRVRYEADILVAGGGPAGVAAAVAAARQNRSVRLIEAHSC
ncbi:FAD-dependent oxidoreductase, partial [candidate division KSB1 bacterium]